jgi:hypothetical protein
MSGGKNDLIWRLLCGIADNMPIPLLAARLTDLAF